MPWYPSGSCFTIPCCGGHLLRPKLQDNLLPAAGRRIGSVEPWMDKRVGELESEVQSLCEELVGLKSEFLRLRRQILPVTASGSVRDSPARPASVSSFPLVSGREPGAEFEVLRQETLRRDSRDGLRESRDSQDSRDSRDSYPTQGTLHQRTEADGRSLSREDRESICDQIAAFGSSVLCEANIEVSVGVIRFLWQTVFGWSGILTG